jgi:hypothetical protein
MPDLLDATGDMESDEEPTTEDILAAFRRRRQAASDPDSAGSTDPAGPGHDPLPAASEPSRSQDGSESSVLPPVAPPGWTLAGPPEDAGAPVLQSTWRSPEGGSRDVALAPSSSAQGAMTIRPAVQGGEVALSASSPALNLSSRLLEDRFVSRAGNRTGVAVGVVLALAGLALIVADQALLSRGIAFAPLNTDLSSIGVLGAALGLVVAVPFLFFPRRRSLRVRLAATQQEEWARVKAEAAVLRKRSIAGAVTALAGLTLSAASYALIAPPEGGYLAGVLALVALGGTAVLAWAAARRGVVQRLYVQTLVLSRLEQTGLGPAAEPDPRVAPVLRSLDKLLGALPESAVRRFLASDEATQYLELIDDLSKDRRHGP